MKSIRSIFEKYSVLPDRVYDFGELGKQKVISVTWELHTEIGDSYKFTEIQKLNSFLRNTTYDKFNVSTLFRLEDGHYRGLDWFDLVKFNDWWIVKL